MFESNKCLNEISLLFSNWIPAYAGMTPVGSFRRLQGIFAKVSGGFSFLASQKLTAFVFRQASTYENRHLEY